MRGRPLNPEKWDAICKSIGAYIIYLKNNYGAEPVLFSFNESEMGIDVRQTAAEHVIQIKKLAHALLHRDWPPGCFWATPATPKGSISSS